MGRKFTQGVLSVGEPADGQLAFRNVPAFRYAQGLDLTTSVGSIRVDVSYGGAFYALVEAADSSPYLAASDAMRAVKTASL